MKAVLLSIKPKYCELIASGKKTVEVRKTKPKLETPFKVYIYETKGYDTLFGKDKPKKLCVSGGRVIGEFVCDEIIVAECGHYVALRTSETMIDPLDLMDYADCKTVYGWHISNLKIYDKPKELSEFQQCHKCKHTCLKTEQNKDLCQYHRLTRPPQSWCYVESEVAE